MIKFYTNNCPNCKILKSLMDKKGIEYEVFDDENIYMNIANENNIRSMPFAEIDGIVLNTKKLQEYIMRKEVTKNE